MKRIIVAGIGNNYRRLKHLLLTRFDVIALCDNSVEMQGNVVDGFTVKSLDAYSPEEVDFVVITPFDNIALVEQLLGKGFAKKQLITDGIEGLSSSVPIRISFSLYGGLGDFLIARKYLTQLVDKYNLAEEIIDVFADRDAMHNAKNAFEGCTFVSEIKDFSQRDESKVEELYDVSIHQCIFPYVESLRGHFLNSKNAQFLDYLLDVQRFNYHHMVEGFPSSPGFSNTVKQLFELLPRKYHTFYDLFNNLNATDEFPFELPISMDERRYLASLSLEHNHYIVVNTGQNYSFQNKGNTRLWTNLSWNELTTNIKEKYPSLKIVQVGTCGEDGVNAVFSDVYLNGKTDFEQIKTLLKHALILIDYDSGLVHLRHIVRGGLSLVLLGPTGVQKHLYDENQYIYENVCKCQPCEWKTPEWIYTCAMGGETPACMNAISPKMVLERLEKIINSLESN